MLERYLITHCAPTLASLKTASMFSAPLGLGLEQQLCMWNRQLRGKGLFLMVLRSNKERAWIYVCRKSYLQADLCRPGVAGFLEQFGYQSTEAGYALGQLKKRMGQQASFPHEIGIFLGYPLGDVEGFIRNAGRNSKCTGCWKVYCNECEAMKLFAQFDKCRRIYARLWRQGKTVWQLTVAA